MKNALVAVLLAFTPITALGAPNDFDHYDFEDIVLHQVDCFDFFDFVNFVNFFHSSPHRLQLCVGLPTSSSPSPRTIATLEPLIIYLRYLSVNNGQSGGAGSTYIQQYIPTLCAGVHYTLTYTSQISIFGGDRGRACSVYYSLESVGQLVHIGPPNGDYPPFSPETRTYTFETGYNGPDGDLLTITLSCNAPAGGYRVDSVSLVGDGEPGNGE
ncbi:MAG: hypothetical protein Q9182_004472 [Xanthomendoza sp. 2 TL-2023]